MILISSKHGFVGNSAALLSLFIENKSSEYEVIWKGNNHGVDNRKITSWQSTGLIKEAMLLTTTKFAFFSHTPADVALYIPKSVCCVNLWHGNPIKYILKDNAVENKIKNKTIKILFNQDPTKCDFFISGSSFYNPIMERCTGLSPEKIINVGLPRNLFLFDYKNKGKYCLFAPTFNDKYTQETLVEELANKWCKIFKTQRIKLHIKLHPNDKTDLSNVQKLPWVVVEDKGQEINGLMVFASMLITDFSSIAFDFMILKRPVFLMLQQFNQCESLRGGTYFSANEVEDIFICSKSIDQLIEKIENYDNKCLAVDDERFNSRFDLNVFLNKIKFKK